MASFVDINGKTKAVIRRKGFPTQTKTFIRKADAKAWARKVESQIEQGLFIDNRASKQTLFSSILDRYYLSCKKKGLKSLKFIEAHSRIIKRSLGSLPLDAITSQELSKYRDYRLETVSPATTKLDLGIIERAIKMAVDEWGYNLASIPKVKHPSVKNARSRRLAEGELEQLLEGLENSECKIIVQFAIETGMRRGEIANLKWQYIHLEKKTLHIPETKTKTPRTIPLTNKAYDLLIQVKNKDIGNVFKLKPDSISQAFERACVKADIQDLRFHDLRHEATSRFFEMGLNIMEVSAITGHQDLKMLKRYTHLRAEDLALKLRNQGR